MLTMAATEPIRDKNQLKSLADYYLHRGWIRNYTLIIMGVYTALRISDLFRLRWSDVYDKQRQDFRPHITVTEHKTGKIKTIALIKRCLVHSVSAYYIAAMTLYLPIIANKPRQLAEYRLGVLFTQQQKQWG